MVLEFVKKQKIVIAGLGLMVLILGFVNCQSNGFSSSNSTATSSNEATDSTSAIGNGDVRVLLKKDIFTLLKGTYSQNCAKNIDDVYQGPDTGSSIAFDASSFNVKWGSSQIDLVNSKSSEFNLQISSTENTVSSKFDIVDANTMARQVVVAVDVEDLQTIAATLTDERVSPKVGDMCLSSIVPDALKANLWGIINKYISGVNQDVTCVNLFTMKQTQTHFSFGSSGLQLSDLKIQANETRALEGLSVVDFDPDQGFSYAVKNSTDNQITVYFDPNKNFTQVTWIKPDGSMLSCK